MKSARRHQPNTNKKGGCWTLRQCFTRATTTTTPCCPRSPLNKDSSSNTSQSSSRRKLIDYTREGGSKEKRALVACRSSSSSSTLLSVDDVSNICDFDQNDDQHEELHLTAPQRQQQLVKKRQGLLRSPRRRIVGILDDCVAIEKSASNRHLDQGPIDFFLKVPKTLPKRRQSRTSNLRELYQPPIRKTSVVKQVLSERHTIRRCGDNNVPPVVYC